MNLTDMPPGSLEGKIRIWRDQSDRGVPKFDAHELLNADQHAYFMDKRYALAPHSWGLGINGPEDIEELVNPPLVKPMQLLFERNIDTLDSSPLETHELWSVVEGDDGTHYAYIDIDWRTLERPNRTIAQAFINEGVAMQYVKEGIFEDKMDALRIIARIPESGTPEEIAAKVESDLSRIAKSFKVQKIKLRIKKGTD